MADIGSDLLLELIRAGVRNSILILDLLKEKVLPIVLVKEAPKKARITLNLGQSRNEVLRLHVCKLYAVLFKNLRAVSHLLLINSSILTRYLSSSTAY